MHASVAAQTSSTGRGRFYKILTALTLTLALSLAALVLVPSANAGHNAGEGPTITEFSPRSATPGTYVWVDGDGFTESDVFALGGIQVEHDIYSETRIGFTVPDIQPANYALEIQNDEGGSSLCCLTIDSGDNTSQEDTDSEVDDADEPADETDTTTTSTATSTSSSDTCDEPKKNIQCNQFGRIEMPAQVDIRGEPVEITAKIWLNTNYENQESRATMFSIRNVTSDGGSPISIALQDFSTDAGEIYTSRIDQHANEINIWVDVLDLPTNTEIELTVLVGSSDRGAYQLETLVMPFDRGYEPIKDAQGQDMSLFSFTLLGVNGETGEVSSGGNDAFFGKIPGFGVMAAVAALGAVTLGLARRRKA